MPPVITAMPSREIPIAIPHAKVRYLILLLLHLANKVPVSTTEEVKRMTLANVDSLSWL
jgi:hypothetical protein